MKDDQFVDENNWVNNRLNEVMMEDDEEEEEENNPLNGSWSCLYTWSIIFVGKEKIGKWMVILLIYLNAD